MRTMHRIALDLALLATLCGMLAACSVSGSSEREDLEAVRTAYMNGFYIEAKEGYESYLQRYPKGESRLEAWERLLEIALNVKGDLDRSIVLLEAMILEYGEKSSSAWTLMFQLAELYEQRGDRTKALDTWQKCLELGRDDTQRKVETLLRMAAVHRVLHNYDRALTLLQKCEELSPDGPTRARCQYEEAQTYSFMQSWGQAKEVLEVIMADGVADKDTQALAVFLLADVYEQEMDYDRARELFLSIANTYPNPKVIQIRLEKMGKGH
ncbi:MAG: tetratricopeptide repeat protein [Desulfovibrio sp.]